MVMVTMTHQKEWMIERYGLSAHSGCVSSSPVLRTCPARRRVQPGPGKLVLPAHGCVAEAILKYARYRSIYLEAHR